MTEPIAKELRHGGFDLRQISRIGDVAVYEQSKVLNGKRRIISYEVIRIRVRPSEMTPSGRSYPEREVYPSDGKWGTDAFTITDLDEALERAKKWDTSLSAFDSDEEGV